MPVLRVQVEAMQALAGNSELQGYDVEYLSRQLAAAVSASVILSAVGTIVSSDYLGNECFSWQR